MSSPTHCTQFYVWVLFGPMNATAFLERLRHSRHYRQQIVHAHCLDARPACYRAPLAPLPERLRNMLAAEGIEQLYSHQAEAFDAIASGEHIVVATGTASGKSLCYHLPVLARLTQDTEARGLYLFPAKALAYDQLANLERLIERAGLSDVARPACYDGDTPTHKRPGARRSATILLSNPDMLHQSILPYHPKWAGFFARLRFVVVDEIHTYRGIFGSHVAGVLRRLTRICRHYGGEPQFICCSATIANPAEHAARLINAPVRVIDRDGSPRGRKWFVLWNPPLLGKFSDRDDEGAGPPARGVATRPICTAPVELGVSPLQSTVSATPAVGTLLPARAAEPQPPPETRHVGLLAHGEVPAAQQFTIENASAPGITRRSGNVEAQELLQALIEAGAGTIAFTKARVVAELIYKYTREGLQRRRPDLADRIRPYRGGYLPIERREIEAALFSGKLLGVCSTNALELGIDVGSLDAAILVGFPGTLCSLWQQAGRAGRRQDESVVFFVAYDDPLDQYLMRNPEFVVSAQIERAVVDPYNPHILAGQLACAAFELPLGVAELSDFGAGAADVAEALAATGRLKACGVIRATADAAAHANRQFHYAESEFPAAKTDLRTISSATYAIMDVTNGATDVLGNVDSISAPEQIYPGAIYLHQAQSYLVREYDTQARVARVERYDADYYTQPVLASHCRLVAERQSADIATDCGRAAAGDNSAPIDASHGGRRFFGDVEVRWQTIAYRKFKYYTTELIGQTKLELPPQTINTVAAYLQPPPDALAAARETGRPVSEALSGARNLLMVALPPLAMCDRYDIGGVVDSAQLGLPTIFLYDRFEGGVGYARCGFDHAIELLRMARDLAEGCPCESGCPACVGPPNLRIAIHHDPDVYRAYEIPDKAATLALLRGWIG